MDGGQKTIISLESPIDVKSSDMLVPITNPQFAHNRQKYQGHCLPSSLRFELDGWAAGNNVYNFQASNDEYIHGNWKIKRRYLNNNPAYLFQYYYKQSDGIYDYVGNVCYNVRTQTVTSYNISASDINVQVDSIQGTFRDISFTLTVLPETATDAEGNLTQQLDAVIRYDSDEYTGNIIVGNTVDIGPLRIETVLQNNGIVIITLKDINTSTGEATVQFKKPKKIINTCGDFTYALAEHTLTTNTDNGIQHTFDNSGNTVIIKADGTVTVDFDIGVAADSIQCTHDAATDTDNFDFDLTVNPKLRCTAGIETKISNLDNLQKTATLRDKSQGIIYMESNTDNSITMSDGPTIIAYAKYDRSQQYNKQVTQSGIPVITDSLLAGDKS